MVVNEIRPRVYMLAAIDWSRRLFDGLIPLPEGTSYNAYVVMGSEKLALIDTSDPRTEDVFFKDLEGLNLERIDYVVTNHAEQDHSGTLPKVLERYPEARVVCTAKCKDLLVTHLHIPEDRIMIVGEGDKLDLGDRTLKFLMMPWVHWPETMVTYLVEERILFTCDLFGSHLATSDADMGDECHVYSGAKRYYAEIMMPFRNSISGYLDRIEAMDIDAIAPSHGPIYNQPEMIINAYKEWTSDEVKNEVIIPYVSMHGSTEAMVNYLSSALIKRGIKVLLFDLTVTDIGELAMALVDAATVVFGVPTVHAGPHPLAFYAAAIANALRPKTRFVSVIGSYGWGSRTVDIMKDTISNLKAEIIEGVYIKGHPREDDIRALDGLAEQIYEKHRRIGLVK